VVRDGQYKIQPGVAVVAGSGAAAAATGTD